MKYNFTDAKFTPNPINPILSPTTKQVNDLVVQTPKKNGCINMKMPDNGIIGSSDLFF